MVLKDVIIVVVIIVIIVTSIAIIIAVLDTVVVVPRRPHNQQVDPPVVDFGISRTALVGISAPLLESAYVEKIYIGQNDKLRSLELPALRNILSPGPEEPGFTFAVVSNKVLDTLTLGNAAQGSITCPETVG